MPDATSVYNDRRARLAIYSTVTGLTYTNTTGVLSLHADYTIPTTVALAAKLGISDLASLGTQAITTTGQVTFSDLDVTQSAATLQDGSAFTGTDATMSTLYQAVRFQASAAHAMGDFQVRVKRSGTITNPTAYLIGYIYADDGGGAAKPTGAALAAGTSVRYGTLTASYQTLSVGTTYTMVNGTWYWLVLKQSAAPTGGTIVLDSDVSANEGATSPDGSAWTNTNVRLRYVIRGTTTQAAYGSSTNAYGGSFASVNSYAVYGSSVNGYAGAFISTNSTGVYGSSANSYGVYGDSTAYIGVYGTSVSSAGVYGTSTSSVGVQGISTGGSGVYGTSSTGRSGYFYRNTSTTPTQAVCDVVQDHTGDSQAALRVQQDGTGYIQSWYDGATLAAYIADGGVAHWDYGLFLPDSATITLGTGSDATLTYDGTDVIFNTRAVGTGNLKVTGGSIYPAGYLAPTGAAGVTATRFGNVVVSGILTVAATKAEIKQLPVSAWIADLTPIVAGDKPAALVNLAGRAAWAFDSGADEEAIILANSFQMPAWYAAGGTLKVDIQYNTTATSGNVQWDVRVEAVTAGDALNTVTTRSFAAANTVSSNVPGNAGYAATATATLSNADSVAAGDWVTILIRRDTPNDNAAADVNITSVTLYEEYA